MLSSLLRQGLRGPTGPVGPVGEAGTRGVSGPTGPTGSFGGTGATGSPYVLLDQTAQQVDGAKTFTSSLAMFGPATLQQGSFVQMKFYSLDVTGSGDQQYFSVIGPDDWPLVQSLEPIVLPLCFYLSLEITLCDSRSGVSVYRLITCNDRSLHPLGVTCVSGDNTYTFVLYTDNGSGAFSDTPVSFGVQILVPLAVTCSLTSVVTYMTVPLATSG
jgi:hypothetical protein